MSFWIRIALVIKTRARTQSLGNDVPRELQKWIDGLGRSGKKEGNIVGVEVGNFHWVFMQPDHGLLVSVHSDLDRGCQMPTS